MRLSVEEIWARSDMLARGQFDVDDRPAAAGWETG